MGSNNHGLSIGKGRERDAIILVEEQGEGTGGGCVIWTGLGSGCDGMENYEVGNVQLSGHLNFHYSRSIRQTLPTVAWYPSHLHTTVLHVVIAIK